MRPISTRLRTAVISLLLCATHGPAVAGAETVRIGMVVDGPWSRNDEITALFRKEIADLLEGATEIEFPQDQYIVSDYTVASVQQNLDRLLANPDCDIVIAMGVIASYLACQYDAPDKPVIAPFIIDPGMQEVATVDGTSGTRNLSFLTSPFSVERDLRVFYDIYPFHKLVVFDSAPFLSAMPGLREWLRTAAEPLGVEVVYRSLEYNRPGAVTRALNSIPAGADAVYYTAMNHLSEAEFDSLIAGVNARGIASFALLGRTAVERGVLFGLSAASVFPKFARRVALNVQRIIAGEDAGSLSVAFSGGERLTVNMQTARQIGVSPAWEVLTEAEVIDGERKDVRETWSLDRAIREALRVNLSLRIAEQAVAVGERDVDASRSPLLPQLDVSASGMVVGEDDAAASFGMQPERSVTGSASLLQVLYSENAWIPYRAQKHIQRAVEHDRDVARLDVGLEAAEAFLNLLRARTSERIAQDNLRLTRENLERARVRRNVGMAGPEEVYRWESNLASGRTLVIDANASRNVAEIEFNRVLRRPLEEPFSTEEVGIDDPALIGDMGQLRGYMSNPASFRIFRRFMVREALRRSPEVRAVESQIAAQQSVRAGTERSFLIPDVSLYGDISSMWWKDGAGSDPVGIPGFPSRDDTKWAVGIQATLPLFAGGARLAERGRAIEETRRLELLRQEVAQIVEQRTRNSLHFMGASSAGIRYTREAADAAARNLEVITDQYARGVVPIITLLDAQNNAFQANLRAANAVYDFLIDVMNVERAIGTLYLLAPDSDREEFLQRIDTYFDEQQSSTNR